MKYILVLLTASLATTVAMAAVDPTKPMVTGRGNVAVQPTKVIVTNQTAKEDTVVLENFTVTGSLIRSLPKAAPAPRRGH